MHLYYIFKIFIEVKILLSICVNLSCYTAFYFGKRMVIDSLLNWAHLCLLCFCKNITEILIACQAYVIITSEFVVTSTDLL